MKKNKCKNSSSHMAGWASFFFSIQKRPGKLEKSDQNQKKVSEERLKEQEALDARKWTIL